MRILEPVVGDSRAAERANEAVSGISNSITDVGSSLDRARDRVAQIITFGKLKARAVLRDTGRILQMSYGHVDRLCKMVPNHPTDPWTLPRTGLGGALAIQVARGFGSSPRRRATDSPCPWRWR